MNAELTSIKTAYEELGMTPQEIAVDRNLDEAAIKAALMQSSILYRRACGAEPEAQNDLNFDDEQLARVNEVIMDLALAAEDEHLRFKAATYVRDDKKGRKDVVRGVQGSGINILFINQQIQKAREMADRMKQNLLGDKAINV